MVIVEDIIFCAAYQHLDETGGVAMETTVCNMSRSKSESISEHLYSCQSSTQQQFKDGELPVRRVF